MRTHNPSASTARRCRPCESLAADGLEIEHVEATRRGSQRRKVVIRSVHVDLPPDISVPLRQIAKKAGLTPEALILDILRDVIAPMGLARAEVAIAESAAAAELSEATA